jgi:SAM-dependent methyltransferase
VTGVPPPQHRIATSRPQREPFPHRGRNLDRKVEVMKPRCLGSDTIMAEAASVRRSDTAVVCPHCHAQFRPSTNGMAEESSCRCGAIKEAEDGTLYLSDGRSSHGELSAAEMEQFLESVQRRGWRSALLEYADPRQQRMSKLIGDPSRASFLRHLPPATGRRAALDLGCGYGGIAALLAREFDDVYALDGSSDRLRFLSLRAAQDKLSNITRIVHDDMRRLPLKSGSMDVISLFGVLEYLPLMDPDNTPEEVQSQCVREMARVLSDGGSLVVGTKNRFGWNFLLGARDHNKVPFGPALPRRLADGIARACYAREYRVINHSFHGYRRMLERHFREVRFLWPIPSYQKPMILTDAKGASQTIVSDAAIAYGVAARQVLRLAGSLGVLHLLVPNFIIIATK